MRRLLCAAACVAVIATVASAQSYPTRSITAVVPASAGGPANDRDLGSPGMERLTSAVSFFT